MAEVNDAASSELAMMHALLIADYRLKVADAKSSTPRGELAARLAALRAEYLAAVKAARERIRQQARQRRRAAMRRLIAKQQQERLMAACRAAGQEMGQRKLQPNPQRPSIIGDRSFRWSPTY
jgi:hypothetical protein